MPAVRPLRGAKQRSRLRPAEARIRRSRTARASNNRAAGGGTACNGPGRTQPSEVSHLTLDATVRSILDGSEAPSPARPSKTWRAFCCWAERTVSLSLGRGMVLGDVILPYEVVRPEVWLRVGWPVGGRS